MSKDKTYYKAYVIPEQERERILDLFPAKFDVTVAHHVTYEYDSAPDEEPPKIQEARIVGCHSNDRIQALVIELDDQRFQQTAGEKRYLHLTMSRDSKQNVRDVESNTLLENIVKERSEKALYNMPEPMTIQVQPVCLSHPSYRPDSVPKPRKLGL